MFQMFAAGVVGVVIVLEHILHVVVCFTWSCVLFALCACVQLVQTDSVSVMADTT